MRLSQFDTTMISDIRLRQATNQLLTRESEVVEEMVEEGLLSEQNAEEVSISNIPPNINEYIYTTSRLLKVYLVYLNCVYFPCKFDLI